MTTFTLPGIPTQLQWMNTPLDWKVEADGSLAILAGAGTNWFIDPAEGRSEGTGPVALFAPPDSSFLLSARMRVDFASVFDGGILFVYVTKDRWAKLCFEYSPQRQPMIVSVVTRGVSDDCNSVVIDGQEVYLRIAKTPQTITFHYSRDGQYWHMVRYFTLGKTDDLRVGFLSQSPTGASCRTVFSKIAYRPGVLADSRSGG